MNGLEIIDEKTPGFTDKLLRREPKENAFIEINNLIASAPLEQISSFDIERILQAHEISTERAKLRLLHIYSRVLAHFAHDFQLSDAEASGLLRLQDAFALTGDETGGIHAAVLYPIFQNAVKNAIFDGKLTAEEERWLNIVAKKLRIPDNFIAELYGTVVQPFIQSKLEKVLADKQFSPEDERELFETGKSLKANINFPEPVRAILVRARFLWQLGNGALPRLEVPIYLNKNEFCAAFVPASLRESREETSSTTNFSERRRLYRDMVGRDVTIGEMSTKNTTEQVVKEIDSGTLFFTNERLLFNGSRENFEDDLKDIVGASFDPDGLRIERRNGPDRKFVLDGDKEALQLIFDKLVNDARR